MSKRKMPDTGLDSKAYRKLYERLYYARVYRAKKIAMCQAWQAINPDKVKINADRHNARNKEIRRCSRLK